jgi:hypothetical protein
MQILCWITCTCYLDNTEARSVAGDRIYQRKECDTLGSCIRREEAVCGPVLLGEGIARAPTGHAAAAPPSNVMNSRRLMGILSLRGSHPTTSSKSRVVHHSILAHSTSATGQNEPPGAAMPARKRTSAMRHCPCAVARCLQHPPCRTGLGARRGCRRSHRG